MLAYRDLRVKYAQTLLGLLWAVLNPLVNLALLSFVFHRLADVDTAGRPAWLYTIAGLSAWTYFAEVFSQAGDAFLANQAMVKKIYFPRLALPLSKALAALPDLLIVLVLTALLMVYYRFSPMGSLLYFPLFLLLAILAGLSAGVVLSALTIRFRDFRFVAPVLLRVGMFITPIAYPAALVPEHYRWLYFLNPLAGIVEGFKWTLVAGPPPPPEAWYGFGVLLVTFVGGIYYFSRVEARMADIL